ncbi:hypothetical protein [Bradyrhizobium sp.]|uniref:hypothetical protein n=1 Tax=Bradyrhizobium sp. TaxID=376 RepID=UPI002D1FAA59|nr:hypothetical protein [Bradyrhizobium sp.]
MALNKEWHRLNRMPPRATREQRIRWHVAHARDCSCREIPDSIKADVEKLLKTRRRAPDPEKC